MTRKAIGTVLITLGVVLVVAALIFTGITVWNEERSGENARQALEQLRQEFPQATPSTPQRPEVTLPVTPLPEDPAQEESLKAMPEVIIDGVPYVGYLSIPALNLELPVIGESNEENLEIAPCRFYGTAYQKNFVIGGHRYRRHFRKLSTLGYGEKISFTDMDGNVFTYEVTETEILQPYQAEYLCSGDWDLSLYTCTPGGLTRVVMRCLLAE